MTQQKDEHTITSWQFWHVVHTGSTGDSERNHAVDGIRAPARRARVCLAEPLQQRTQSAAVRLWQLRAEESHQNGSPL